MKMIRFIATLLLFSLSANIDLFGNQDRKKAIKSRKEHQKAARIKKAQEKSKALNEARAHQNAKAAQKHEQIQKLLNVQNNQNNNIFIEQDQNLINNAGAVNQVQEVHPIQEENVNLEQHIHQSQSKRIGLIFSALTIIILTIHPKAPDDIISLVKEFLCNKGFLEYCTKEQLCTIWHNIAACTELCKDGILKYCTKEQLCNIHNIWKHCPCSIEDLRGCLPALCKNLPYCPEVITWLAETFSTAPEALIKMFV